MLRDKEVQNEEFQQEPPTENARSKMHSSATMLPKVSIPEANDPTSKAEMSAATITALRAMMREEIKNGMLEMEDRFSNKLQQAVGNMKKEVTKTTLMNLKMSTKQWLLSEGLWTKQLRKWKHWWRR